MSTRQNLSPAVKLTKDPEVKKAKPMGETSGIKAQLSVSSTWTKPIFSRKANTHSAYPIQGNFSNKGT